MFQRFECLKSRIQLSQIKFNYCNIFHLPSKNIRLWHHYCYRLFRESYLTRRDFLFSLAFKSLFLYVIKYDIPSSQAKHWRFQWNVLKIVFLTFQKIQWIWWLCLFYKFVRHSKLYRVKFLKIEEKKACDEFLIQSKEQVKKSFMKIPLISCSGQIHFIDRYL